MDWQYGFSSKTYITIVDPTTWRDINRLEITDGSVSREETGLRESCDLTCRVFDLDQEYWIRVWADIRQNENIEHHAVFTGLTSSPTIEIKGTWGEIPLECYSVLKPAEDVLLPRGWFAGEGMNGAEIVADLLSVTPAPIFIEGVSKALDSHIIAEDGESRLSMADKVLQAIGWRLRIAGDGRITICEYDMEPRARFGNDYDIVEPELSIERDWFGCPNVFRAVSDGIMAIARDDAENSILSTINRGREVWKEETSCNFNDGETITEYAERRLRELQSVATNIPYIRRYRPDVVVGDMIELDYPQINLTGRYIVKSQSLSLGSGMHISETVTN